jgi:hypothetical protein
MRHFPKVSELINGKVKVLILASVMEMHVASIIPQGQTPVDLGGVNSFLDLTSLGTNSSTSVTYICYDDHTKVLPSYNFNIPFPLISYKM